jgi:hypothetical protein
MCLPDDRVTAVPQAKEGISATLLYFWLPKLAWFARVAAT